MTKKILIVALLIPLLNLLPALFACINTPDGYYFTGVNTYFDPKDINTYFAKMRNGYEGEWLWVNRYTSEEFPKIPLFPFYTLLGHLARVLRVPIPLTYYGAAFVLGSAFLLILWHFICIFMNNESWRYRFLALVLVGFGGGAGGFVLDKGIHFPDISYTDATFFSTLNFPHMILNQILFLLILLYGYQSIRQRNLRKSLIAGILSLLLSFIHPYTLFVALFILFTYGLFGVSASLPTKNWRSLNFCRFLLPSLLVLVATIFYYNFFIIDEPLVRVWLAQQEHTSPPVHIYLLGYGVLTIFVIVGFWTLIKRVENEKQFLISWVTSQFLLLYLPVYFQRLLIKGLFIGLCLVAVCGIKTLRRRIPRWALFLLIITVFITNVRILIRRQRLNFVGNRYFYISLAEKEALEYLHTSTEKEAIVLSSLLSGNKIPAQTGKRVYLGHRFETINSKLKEKIVENIFSGKYEEASLKMFLKDEKIDYIFCGVDEQAMGGSCLKGFNDFERVFNNEQVTIYKVL